MKVSSRIKGVLIAFICVLVLIGVTATPISAGKPLHSVQGGGTNYYVGDANVFIAGNLLTTLAFTAVQTESSGPGPNAKGKLFLKVRAPDNEEGVEDLWFTADILYLSVGGNNAWVGYKGTNSNDPLFIGWEGIFQIQDNGQDANSLIPDKLSGFYPGVPASKALLQENLGLLGDEADKYDFKNGDIKIN